MRKWYRTADEAARYGVVAPAVPRHRGEELQKLFEQHRWRRLELKGLEVYCFRAQGKVWAVLPPEQVLRDWLMALGRAEKRSVQIAKGMVNKSIALPLPWALDFGDRAPFTVKRGDARPHALRLRTAAVEVQRKGESGHGRLRGA